MEETVLTIDHLTVRYGQTKILDDLSVCFPCHQVIGLVGLNGADKSTFIDTISGIIKEYNVESIQFNGCEMSDRFDNLSFKKERYTVFDYEQSFGHWKAMAYIKFVHKAYHKELNPERLAELMTGFHFEPYMNVPLSKLSFGNKKKVFLMSGLLLERPLLLLDEPIDGLDFESTEFLYQEIQNYTRYGTVVISSHILDRLEKSVIKFLCFKINK